MFTNYLLCSNCQDGHGNQFIMKTLYDVQQLLEKYGIFVHVGKRIWDIELMALELDNINHSHLIDQHDYLVAKLILRREYEYEERHNKDKHKY